jgi:hypothetical protein
MSRPKTVRMVPLAVLGAAVLAPHLSPAAGVSDNAMKACAAIAAPTDRLACYDQLAGRPATAGAAPPAAAPSAAAPSAAAPSAAAVPAGAPSSAARVGASAVAAPPPVPAAVPEPKEAFGLYSAEHPIIPAPAALLTATVIGIGSAPTGRPTVTLEGGQLWELDSSDPLLAMGQSVTIKRASLGSFLMTTSTGRTHRVHRLH